jgi:hypothetical protein
VGSQDDATALAACKTFSGSIAVSTAFSGSMALDSVQQITGDLVAANSSELIELSGSDLQTIGGSFKLEALQLLTTLNFPKLSKVEALQWNALPNLQDVGFTQGINAKQVNIQVSLLSGQSV